MPSSQALCLGILSGYFPSLSGASEGLEGSFVSVFGGFGLTSCAVFMLKFGLRFGRGFRFGSSIVSGVDGLWIGSGKDDAMWVWISNSCLGVGDTEAVGGL